MRSKKTRSKHSHSHPHPNTFHSGGHVSCKQTDTHIHAELASSANGNIDFTQPHVLTSTEQNALVWLVYRNRQKIQVAKANEPVVLCVPNIDPTLCTLHTLEENLGSDSVSLMDKIYRLAPTERHAKEAIALFQAINELGTLEQKITALQQQFVLKNTQLITYLEEYQSQKHVKTTYMFFLLPEHIGLLEKLYDELFKVHSRKQQGIANFSSCTKVRHDHFPSILGTADDMATTKASAILDKISNIIPTDCIVFNEPKKQSKGGWRVWRTDEENTFAATLLAQPNNDIIGSKVIEAMELVFNAVGLKAQRRFQTIAEHPTVVVTFTMEQLRAVNITLTKQLFSEGIKMYSKPLNDEHVANMLKK